MDTKHTGVPARGAKHCGLLIRRPQVRTLLGPPRDTKQKLAAVRRLAAGRITIKQFRRAFGVAGLIGGAA